MCWGLHNFNHIIISSGRFPEKANSFMEKEWEKTRIPLPDPQSLAMVKPEKKIGLDIPGISGLWLKWSYGQFQLLAKTEISHFSLGSFAFNFRFLPPSPHHCSKFLLFIFLSNKSNVLCAPCSLLPLSLYPLSSLSPSTMPPAST